MTASHRLIRTALGGMIASASWLAMSSSAAAQTTPSEPSTAADEVPDASPAAGGAGSGEVVVTARRRVENLQDVPLSVTAFGSEQIDRQNLRSLEDVAELTPGLSFEKGFIGQDTRPQIRGLPASRGRPPVGILLDGIDISSESLSGAGGSTLVNLRLLDIERVEVVKGPQSALYGRVAFGGAVNYVTKGPSDEFSGDVLVSGTPRGDTYEARVSLSGPVAGDTFGVRATGSYSRSDGYYRNSVTGRTIGGFENYGGSVSARLRVGDNFTVNGRLAYTNDVAEPAAQYYLGAGNGGQVALPVPANLVGVSLGGAPIGATYRTARPGVIRAGDQIALSANPRTGRDYRGTTLEATFATLRTEYDFGSIMLNTWSSYVDANTGNEQDIDFLGAPATTVSLPAPGGTAEPLRVTNENFMDNDIRQLSQEVRIGDLTSRGFRWAVGGLYWDEKVSQEFRSLTTVLFSPTASAALNTQLTGNPVAAGKVARDTEHWSIYGLVEADLSDQLTVTAEGRYSEESYDYKLAPFLGAYAPGTVPAPNFTLPGETANSKSNFFAPRFGLQYKPTDDAMVYASAARGVKPGGFSSITRSAALAKYGTETVWNYEAGLKTTWLDRRLFLNAAAFYMDYKGKQTSSLVLDPVTNLLSNDQGNAGQARIFGLEFDGTARFSRALSLFVGYAYLDTKYLEFLEVTNNAYLPTLAGNCTLIAVGTARACSVDRSGNRLEGRQSTRSFPASHSSSRSIRAGHSWPRSAGSTRASASSLTRTGTCSTVLPRRTST